MKWEWNINLLVLAAAILVASVPGWYGAIEDYRHRDAGKQAQTECLSLVAALAETEPGAEGLYVTCMAARIRGGSK